MAREDLKAAGGIRGDGVEGCSSRVDRETCRCRHVASCDSVAYRGTGGG